MTISIKNTLFEYLKARKIKPIRPVQVFEAAQIEDALRYMQTGTHMGKIVIQMPSDTKSLSSPKVRKTASFPSDTSYLLVGGLGGIGCALSTWLVEHGVRELVHLSRSAGQSESDQMFVRELKAQGCRVSCVAGSVSNLADVKRAVNQCTNRLAGVVQMAIQLKVRGTRASRSSF